MSWFKVDDDFFSSPKVLAIPRRMRARACGLWVLAGSWSASALTDGRVPKFMLSEFASTPAAAAELVRVGLWTEEEQAFYFHDWGDYQPTRKQVISLRESARKRKAESRKAKYTVSNNPPTSSDEEMSQCDMSVSHRGVTEVSPRARARAYPDPTRPEIEGGGVVVIGNVVRADDDDAPPSSHPGAADRGGADALRPDRCARHQSTPDGLVPPCRACQTAREAVEQHHSDTAQQARYQRKQAITACGFCDDNGMREIPHPDDPARTAVARCDHRPPWEV